MTTAGRPVAHTQDFPLFSVEVARPSASLVNSNRPHLFSRGGERRVEPLLERGDGLEDGGQQEVEQGPQLGQLVLQRSAGQQEAVRRVVGRVEHKRQLAVVVLHAVALVDDHILPAALRGGGADGCNSVVVGDRRLM